jgi:hypothetical protein
MDPAAPDQAQCRAPLSLFVLELSYLVVLAALFVGFTESVEVREFLPRTLGPLPTETPWFGAVGAVLAGLSAHFFHYDDWKASYNRWHISRPLLGAFEGPIGCLILVVVVRAASTKATGTEAAFYDVVAFLVGFAEKTFRDLIGKATEMILSPGGPSGEQNPPRSGA